MRYFYVGSYRVRLYYPFKGQQGHLIDIAAAYEWAGQGPALAISRGDDNRWTDDAGNVYDLDCSTDTLPTKIEKHSLDVHLQALVKYANLDQLVYDVRADEGQGWEGPAVIAVGEAVEAIQNYVKE